LIFNSDFYMLERKQSCGYNIAKRADCENQGFIYDDHFLLTSDENSIIK